MAWLVWGGIGGVLIVLLVVSWWFDRDARRRGAIPRGSGDMASSASDNRRTTRVREQQSSLGATPRSTEAVTGTWRRRDEQRPPAG